MDLIIYEAFAEEIVEITRCLPPTIAAEFVSHTIQESRHARPPARLISIRNQSRIPADWTTKITGVLSRTTGYDHLTSLARVVPCCYLPLYCTRAVAEQAVMLMLALLRKLPNQLKQFDRFNRDGLTGLECAGKKLLVVGVGNIGSEIVRLGQGLGMDVRGVDLVQRHAFVSYTDIGAGLAWADVVICAMNLTQDNVGYFKRAQWQSAKGGAWFVNIARGELSPTGDLIELLDTGVLAGVALDVFDDEDNLSIDLREGKSGGKSMELLRALGARANVIFTPHNAFNSLEGVERKSRQTVDQAIRFLKTGRFIWPVPVG